MRGARRGDGVSRPSQEEKAARFRALHESGCFVIPNPWDLGSAKVFAGLGFEALATTSSAFAFTLGRPDGGVTLEELIPHVEAIDAATSLPVSVDLENAVAAARSLPVHFVLTARAENFIRGNPDLDDTIARLLAFQAAGADVLYAPGLRTADEVRAVCDAVGLPVNVLAHRGLDRDSVAAAGARRISVGGSLAWSAVRRTIDVATEIRDAGSFAGLEKPIRELGDWL